VHVERLQYKFDRVAVRPAGLGPDLAAEPPGPLLDPGRVVAVVGQDRIFDPASRDQGLMDIARQRQVF
jgi:hypothetical protein